MGGDIIGGRKVSRREREREISYGYYLIWKIYYVIILILITYCTLFKTWRANLIIFSGLFI